MKKLAALTLAFVSGIASASAIHIQTGYYGGDGLFADASAFQSVVEGAITTSHWAASYDNLPVTINDGALKSTIQFDTATDGADWTFRAGVDFGKGGAIYLDGVLQQAISDDMWWNYGYTSTSDYFQFTANGLSAGNHTLTLYGLELCCSGNQQVQFKVGDGEFTSFSTNDGLLPVPEGQTYALLLAGLGLVGTLARRRSNKQA